MPIDYMRLGILACCFLLTVVGIVIMMSKKPRQRSKKVKIGYEAFIISAGIILFIYAVLRLIAGGSELLFSFLAVAGIYIASIHIVSNIVGRYN